jgi:penicillin-binding protein 1C
VVVALDPDIPPRRQRVTIIASGAPEGAVLAVDGRALPSSRDAGRLTALWEPVPGVHVVTLADRHYVFDRARLTVR